MVGVCLLLGGDEVFDFFGAAVVGDEAREDPRELGDDGVVAVLGERVLVGSLIEFAFLDEAHLDEIVEVGVESAMVDLRAVVLFEFAFDGEAVARLFGEDGEDALLEGGEFWCDT